MKKYILGLDLGISSVGWAVTGYDDESGIEPWLDDFGVRLFEVPEKPKEKISLATERRGFRSSRRLKRRKKARIKLLKKILEEYGIMSIEEINGLFNFKTSLLKPTNKVEYDKTKYFNPYVIRYEGINKKLSKEELIIALIHITKHRGYANLFDVIKGEDKSIIDENIKIDEKDDYSNSIINARKLIEFDLNTKTCKKTIAQAIIENTNNTRIKDNLNLLDIKNGEKYKFLFPREAYKYELETILNEQSKYYKFIDNNFISKISEIVFRQRDFEDGFGPKNYTREQTMNLIQKQLEELKRNSVKNNTFFALRDSLRAYKLYKPFTELTGHCTFYPNEKRYIKSSIIFDLYQMAIEVSKFSSILEDKEKIKQFHFRLFELVLTDQSFIENSKKQIKSILQKEFGLSKEMIDSSKAVENSQKTNLFEFTKRFIKVFGMDPLKMLNIDKLENNIIDKLGIILNENITPKRREEQILKWAKENSLSLSSENLNQLLLIPSRVTTTSSLSKKAMLDVLEKFLEGKIAGVYQDELKSKALQVSQFTIKKFLGPINDPDLIRNPVVFRAINEARKVLKALFNRYNDFEKINVETSRELGKSAEVRNSINNKYIDNRVNNELYMKQLADYGLPTNSSMLLKYKLWLSQDKKCLYSLKEIKLDQLNTFELEVDHILPISRYPDDSFENKVLVYSKENQEKKNMTPIEYFSSKKPEIIKEYKKYVLNLYRKGSPNGINWAKYENLMVESVNKIDTDKFSSRNLIDNSYIARYFSNWLKLQLKFKNKIEDKNYKSDVLMIKGIVTSRFRRKWLYNSPWGVDIKVRDITPFHHAVDAIILSQFKNQGMIDFASDLISLANEHYSLEKNNISQKQWEIRKNEITNKWIKENNYQWFYQVPHALKKIESFINSGCKQNGIYPLIKNLKDLIELRMPVELKVEWEEEQIKLSEKEINKKIKELKNQNLLELKILMNI